MGGTYLVHARQASLGGRQKEEWRMKNVEGPAKPHKATLKPSTNRLKRVNDIVMFSPIPLVLPGWMASRITCDAQHHIL
jgi:hypothetical protein